MKKLLYLLALLAATPASAQFSEEHQITCDSSLLLDGLGYPTWATPQIVQPPAHGEAELIAGFTGFYLLHYIPQAGFHGTDTVVIECAHATQITCDTGTYIIQVNCLNAVGEGLKMAGLRVFPNPARQFLTVESETQVERLRLVNGLGEVVLEEKISVASHQIQLILPEMPAGIYWVEAKIKGRTTVRKLVVLP